MRHVLLSTFLLFSFLPGQEATASKIYWNSLSTDVNVGVPLADDESLKGGRIQIRVSFNAGKSFSDLGDPFFIEKRDIDDLKEISIQNIVFESMPGFKEGGEAHFIAEIWDKAGNSILGEVSDSVLTIDETIPTIVSLMVTSSNSLDPSLAMPADSLTFDLIASEPIDPPLFEINGDDFAVVGFEKSWKTIYPAEEADDGPITFEIRFNDIAQNPGEPVTTTSDKKIITKDGTIPELDNIKLFTSNQYDTSLAVKGDSVFLQFTASEPVRDLNVTLDHNEAIRKSEDSLTFTFFHVFTESDTEGVIPIAIEFNDMAGNVGELVDQTSDDSEITYDMTPPAAFKVETVGSFQGKQKELIDDVSPDSPDSTGPGTSGSIGLSSIPDLYIMITAGVLVLFCLIIWISWFKIFSKAGQAGWKALVPFFNIFVFTKIVQKPIWWIAIYLIIPVGYILAALQVSKLFGKKIVFAMGLIFIPFVFYPILAFGKSQIGEQPLASEPMPEKKPKKKK